MRVIVCGGRDFGEVPNTIPPLTGDELKAAIAKAKREKDFVYDTLDAMHHDIPTEALAEGGARGADRHAREWAALRNVLSEQFAADWKLHRKAAGPIRNQEMLHAFKPDVVVAFPGGKGTADMVHRATRANVRVIEVSP